MDDLESITDLTLERLDEEYNKTLYKLEILSKMREAVEAREYHRLDTMIEQYKRLKGQEEVT